MPKKMTYPQWTAEELALWTEKDESACQSWRDDRAAKWEVSAGAGAGDCAGARARGARRTAGLGSCTLARAPAPTRAHAHPRIHAPTRTHAPTPRDTSTQ